MLSQPLKEFPSLHKLLGKPEPPARRMSPQEIDRNIRHLAIAQELAERRVTRMREEQGRRRAIADQRAAARPARTTPNPGRREKR